MEIICYLKNFQPTLIDTWTHVDISLIEFAVTPSSSNAFFRVEFRERQRRFVVFGRSHLGGDHGTRAGRAKQPAVCAFGPY